MRWLIEAMTASVRHLLFREANFFMLAGLLISHNCALESTIVRDVRMHLESGGRIKTWSDSKAWEGTVDITETVLATGEAYLFRIRFLDSQAIQVRNTGSNPLNSGIEISKLRLGTSEPTAQRADWRASGTLTYIGTAGSLLVNPIAWDINGGGVPYGGPLDRTNLTDDSFQYSGVDITINFDPAQGEFIDYRAYPPIPFTRLEWSSSAEDVSVVRAIPAPSSLTCMAGLFAMGLIASWWRRRKSS